METGDPGAPGGAPDPEGTPAPPAVRPAPPSPPGWNPAPPGTPPAAGAWPPPPAGSPPGWNPAPPGSQGSPPGWNPVPPGSQGSPPQWAPPPPGGWIPPPPGYPPNATAGAYWNPDLPASGAGGLRPRGVGELLDSAFTLYRRNFLLLVAIAAVVQVPFALISLIVFEITDIGGRLSDLQNLTRDISNQNFVLTPGQSSALLSDVGGLVAYFASVFILQFLVVYPLSQAATTSAVSARYLDQPSSVRASYAAALTRWRSLIAMIGWLVLLVAVPLTVGVLIAVLIGSNALLTLVVLAVVVFYVIILVRTTVAPQAVVLERLSGWAGIRRSMRLTDRSFWRILGIRILLGIIQGIAATAITLPVNAVISGSSLTTQELVGQVAQAVVAVFIAPITLVTLTLLYYDLRIRREGFDIEMLAASL